MLPNIISRENFNERSDPKTADLMDNRSRSVIGMMYPERKQTKYNKDYMKE